MNELFKIAETAVNKLKKAGLTVSTAESCTGGMMSQAITSVPGASGVFSLGMTTYSSEIKHSILGVSKKTLALNGAVSRNTAKEMAVNIRCKAHSDIGVAITGSAGPEPCEGKAPGTVYVALATQNKAFVDKLIFENADRNSVRVQSVTAAFEMILSCIKRGNQDD